MEDEGIEVDGGDSGGEEEVGGALETVDGSIRSSDGVETVTIVLMVQVTASLTALVELVFAGVDSVALCDALTKAAPAAVEIKLGGAAEEVGGASVDERGGLVGGAAEEVGGASVDERGWSDKSSEDVAILGSLASDC